MTEHATDPAQDAATLTEAAAVIRRRWDDQQGKANELDQLAEKLREGGA